MVSSQTRKKSVFSAEGKMNKPLFFILVFVLITAAITDIRRARIPNWLTCPAMLLALGIHASHSGWSGLVFGLEGLATGLVPFLVFYMIGGMGAGDVKLMSAVGCFLGPRDTFTAFVFTAFAGGVYAILLSALHGRLRHTISGAMLPFKSILYTGLLILPQPVKNENKTPKMRYGLAIMSGTLFSCFMTFKKIAF